MDLKKIVVATDFSDTSLGAVETALSLAQESGAALYLLHVVEGPVGIDPVVGSTLATSVEGMKEAALRHLQTLIPANLGQNLSIEKVVIEGKPSHAIAEFARRQGADMIVVGTHGRAGLTRMLLGSTAEHLLREAPCQVLVVKRKVSDEEPAETEEVSTEPI